MRSWSLALLSCIGLAGAAGVAYAAQTWMELELESSLANRHALYSERDRCASTAQAGCGEVHTALAGAAIDESRRR